MKKVVKISILLLIALVLIPRVYALEITTDNTKHLNDDENSYYVTNKGDITINGVVSTDQFQAFRMIETYYNEETNEVSYQLTTLGRNFFDAIDMSGATANDIFNLSGGDITSGAIPKTANRFSLNYFSAMFAMYIKQAEIDGIPLTVSGTTATLNADAGTYMILPTVTNKVYAAMVGNVEFRGTSGEWELLGTTIQAKVSDAGINKYIKETLSREGSFNIGDTITAVTVVTVPTYPASATNKQVYFREEFNNNFFDMDNFTVIAKDGNNLLTLNEYYQFLDEQDNVVASLNAGDGYWGMNIDTDYMTTNTLTIEFTITLNNNLVLGPVGNNGSISLTYSNDPYGTGTISTDPIVSTIYTYGIKVNNKNDQDDVLKNIKYKICSDSLCENEIATIQTDDEGIATISGIKSGTYYLKQVKAPTGYKLDNEIRSIVIDEDSDYTVVNLVSEHMSLLPATGGIGNYVFIAIGVGVIVFALVFLYVNRRKKDSNEKNK